MFLTTGKPLPMGRPVRTPPDGNLLGNGDYQTHSCSG